MIKIFNADALSFASSNEFKTITAARKVCIVTDPPFNIGYHYNKYKDNMQDDKYYKFLADVLTSCRSPFIVIHYAESLHRLSIVTGQPPQRSVSWVYNSNTARQHREIAFYGITPDFKKVRQPYKNPNDKRIKARIERGDKGAKLYDWWNINQVKNVSKKDINHPCVMPVEVMKNIIGIIPEDFIIYDPFCGSGTTAIACAQLNRDFIGCDIDADYCEIAQRRVSEISSTLKDG